MAVNTSYYCCIMLLLWSWAAPVSLSSFESNPGSGIYVDKIGLEQSIAAVLHKVAYGSTTTKRSIPDGVSGAGAGVTTVSTPLLTTFRYRERESERPQEPPDRAPHSGGYELDLERDHALPTSAPNADILKSHGSSTYPNPNRHHNGDRAPAHRPHTPPPPRKTGASPTQWMFSRDVPSYAPPARSYYTPPLPPDYFAFADKPTLRGSNSEGILGGGGGVGGGPPGYANRRPLPPPSITPTHVRIPFRPPDLPGGALSPDAQPPPPEPAAEGRKKALNTPYNRVAQPEGQHNQPALVSPDAGRVDPNGNLTDFMPNGSILHYPSISRILSGSNGRKEEIPAVLLRTVTARPNLMLPASPSPAPPEDKIKDSWNLAKESDRKLVEPEFVPSQVDDSKAPPEESNSVKIQDTTDQALSIEYSTEIIQNLANVNNDRGMYSSTARPSERAPYGPPYTTWTVAWNLHIYLVAILFTILAVYSIFKIICYDKLTHLFSQSYFVCLHLTLILICLSRIFYLCYDPYNIHSSFHMFVSELLLNLPATFLTVSFAILILFLLRRTINLKNNRYSAIVRPLTVIIGSCVHVGLCITLHYVESHSHGNGINQEPRVLGLICQIIYIFVCLSLGLLYLYIYRILKRILRNKSQNYIHGYQNLSYAIHISIATALLFVLLAALQVYGVVDMTTSPRLALAEFDWLQWGYQFSLRLIEVAVITLMSWVAGLRTGTSKSLQREKGMEPHNVSGFALFPCTSSSSQEHFETDYPAICNANTNLHTYTLRTGKPLYDDGFALNSLGTEVTAVPQLRPMDFQMNAAQMGPDVARSVETASACSSAHNGNFLVQSELSSMPKDYLNNSGAVPDHYENPDFELRGTPRDTTPVPNNCYSEPVDMNDHQGHYNHQSVQNLDFKNFERPHFDKPSSRTEFRASKNMKNLKNGGGHHPEQRDYEQQHGSSVYGSGRHSSFERRGVRKSGTMSNIGGVHGGGGGGGGGPRSSGGSRSSGVQTLSSSGRASSKRQHAIPADEFPQERKQRTHLEEADRDPEINGSMLVAEHGFVRFRALDAVPQQAVATAQRASRGKEKRYNT